MTHPMGINVGKKARALAAALALGTAVLSLAAGPAAAAPSQRDDGGPIKGPIPEPRPPQEPKAPKGRGGSGRR